MPLLRKGVLLPSKGVDWSQPSTFIDDRAGFPQNMRFLQNEIAKRPGKTLYGSAAISGGQIMGLGVLELATTKYLVRGSKTSLEKYNTSTAAWDSISVSALTGGDDDLLSFATVTEDGLLIITNGVDAVRKWTGSGNTASLGGTPPKARYACYLSPYLILAYTDDGTGAVPWQVQWCDTNDPETWVGGNSGSDLLSREPSPIQNIARLNEYAAIYKKESLWLGRKVETSDIFMFDCAKTGIGLAAPRAFAEADGAQYFLGANDIYVWNGGQPQSIGGPVRDYLFAQLDRGKINRCFSVHARAYNEIWFFIVLSGQTWPTVIWKYNYKTGFWYYDTCDALTAAINWEKTSTKTWDDMTETWDASIVTWDQSSTVAKWEETVLGMSTGYTSFVDESVANDLGVAVSAQFVTKAYTGDVLEFNKRWLQLDLWARGSSGAKLYVDYSIDGGSTWLNIAYDSSTAYITLTAVTSMYRIYFDVISDYIQFRFRNAESGEIFYLRNFYPYYVLQGETKA